VLAGACAVGALGHRRPRHHAPSSARAPPEREWGLPRRHEAAGPQSVNGLPPSSHSSSSSSSSSSLLVLFLLLSPPSLLALVLLPRPAQGAYFFGFTCCRWASGRDVLAVQIGSRCGSRSLGALLVARGGRRCRAALSVARRAHAAKWDCVRSRGNGWGGVAGPSAALNGSNGWALLRLTAVFGCHELRSSCQCCKPPVRLRCSSAHPPNGWWEGIRGNGPVHPCLFEDAWPRLSRRLVGDKTRVSHSRTIPFASSTPAGPIAARVSDPLPLAFTWAMTSLAFCTPVGFLQI